MDEIKISVSTFKMFLSWANESFASELLTDAKNIK